MRRNRVEYQKFLRIKLDDEHDRNLFGLSENIELEAEKDFVLQREFRIDFVFRKIEPLIPLEGIFSYFRTYNIFEFKSVHDAFDLSLLIKYLGELLWWLHTKDDIEIVQNEITLTIMTVRRPNNVLKHLQQPHLQIGLINESPGHYHWRVMGIPVHLLVINELELCPEHYAWLSFAEGKRFEEYTEQLSVEMAQDEKRHIYLNILRELEEEGKERMADEILSRIISEMPPERVEKLLLGLPAEKLSRTLNRLPADRRRTLEVKGIQRMLSELLQAKFGPLPQEIIDNVQKIESEDRLSDLGKKLIIASSLAELGLA